MKKTYSSGGLVLKRDGKNALLLLVRHKDGFLVFPKGHIQKAETEEQTALREVKEETGLEGLRAIKKLGTITRQSKEDTGEVVEKVIHLFLLETDDYKHQAADEDYDWFTYEEAMRDLGFTQEKQFLEEHWQDLVNR